MHDGEVNLAYLRALLIGVGVLFGEGASADESVAGAAVDPAWVASFAADVLDEPLGDRGRLLVVAFDEASLAAATALGAAVGRDRPIEASLAPSAARGRLDEAAEAALRASPAAGGRRQVLVVRSDDGAAAPARAVVALFEGRGGEALRRLTATAVRGLPAEPANAPLDAVPPPPYFAARDQQRGGLVGFRRPDAPRILRDGQPVVGWLGTKLPGAAFYEAVDRPDLARLYRRRRAGRITAITFGAALYLTAIILGELDASNTPRPACLAQAADGCARYGFVTRQPILPGAAAYPIILGGPLLFIVPLAINWNPLDTRRAFRLANEHNRRVRGGPADDEERPPPRSSLQIVPSIAPGGGQLALVLRF